jgi:hypothetical protein
VRYFNIPIDESLQVGAEVPHKNFCAGSAFDFLEAGPRKPAQFAKSRQAPFGWLFVKNFKCVAVKQFLGPTGSPTYKAIVAIPGDDDFPLAPLGLFPLAPRNNRIDRPLAVYYKMRGRDGRTERNALGND